MRYIGNKTRLLKEIENLLNDKNLYGGIFADLFTGTGSVADYFKDRFHIIANDLQTYAAIFSYAKINNANIPEFKNFKEIYHCSPFKYFNDIKPKEIKKYGFITENYSPLGDRKFFNIDNAKKIDFIRIKINELRNQNILNENEYVFLLASLLESTMGVSNTSGTYEAFFKDWEARSKKEFILEPLSIEEKNIYSHDNKLYVENTNNLIRKIKGDIAYIDTPYTVTQYASAYHLLETLALYDNPEIVGKTGRRKNRIMSKYSKKNQAYDEFNDLFRQLKFKHIIISYSNQSLVLLDDLINLIEDYAVPGTIEVREIDFREYSNLNKSKKQKGNSLKEVLIYFEKDFSIKKSPLNYAGSKDAIIDKIISNLPANISTFIDCMSGACNVGMNVRGVNNIVFNEKQLLVSKLMKQLICGNKEKIVSDIKKIIDKYNLSKGNKEAYNQLRDDFNTRDYENMDLIEFFVLSLYSFQHMIRFNSKGQYNVPVGNSCFTEDVFNRILHFNMKNKNLIFLNQSYKDINPLNYDKNSIFYFDPPYIITSASYNDGNRMNIKWDKDDELELLNYLTYLNNKGYKFILSNVIEHKNIKNQELIDWVQKNDFEFIDVGKTGKRFPRYEVLIKNF